MCLKGLSLFVCFPFCPNGEPKSVLIAQTHGQKVILYSKLEISVSHKGVSALYLSGPQLMFQVSVNRGMKTSPEGIAL